MKKEKPKFYEEMVFDDVQYAKNAYDNCTKKLQKNKIGIIVSLFAPVVGIIFMNLMSSGDTDPFVWLFIPTGIVAVISYIIGGGLLTALKIIWKVTSIAFWVVPTWLFGAIAAWVAFCLTCFVACWFPVVIVLIERYFISKDRKAAEEYLNCCKPVGETVAETGAES